jgi:hypothetical protein
MVDNDEALSLKRCRYLLRTTFVLQIFKIAAPWPKILKKLPQNAQNSKFYSYYENFPKVSLQIVHDLACLVRFASTLEKKITFINLQW